jgi:pimeloyl-ACP methyl ester carboxylesterase
VSVREYPSARAASAAPAVICLHSSASSARQWAPLREALGTGFRTVAPDLLGYGPENNWAFERALSLDDEARQIEPLIAAEDDGVHLVGHSYGGAVALHLALRNPGRVKSVSLYEPVLFNLLHEDPASRVPAVEISSVRIAVRRAVYSGRAEQAAQMFVDYWSGPGAWGALPDKRRHPIVARMRKVDAEFDAVFYNVTSLAAYRRLAMPILAMVGETTRRPPRQILDLLFTVLPDARRQEIAGAGHLGSLTHADDVNARIRAFLDAQETLSPPVSGSVLAHIREPAPATELLRRVAT